MAYRRICLIVLDSVGIGEAPDAAVFGDTGAHTLGHILRERPSLHVPHLRSLGLDRIEPFDGWRPSAGHSRGFYGKMQEVSVGKDTMTGHWELAGLRIDVPFRTFPLGFPQQLLDEFERLTGRGVLGNKPASGTAVLDELGAEQMETGKWIVYTSADSVFQLAAHEQIIPLEELYEACRIARELTMRDEWSVGRVIARPYVGEPGTFKRTSNRHDYAVSPPEPTVLDKLTEAGVQVVSVGKIFDIFNGHGIAHSHPTKSNADGVEQTIRLLRTRKQFESGLLFVNLVDFDSLYGHRRDPQGYGQALEQFDAALPELMAQLNEDDLLILTADHGNDPVHHGTDHTREVVPLIVWSPRMEQGGSLGTRATFADVAATIAHNFGVDGTGRGETFLMEVVGR